MRHLLRLLLAAAVAGPALAGATESLGVLPVGSPPGPGPELIETTAQFRKAVGDRNPGMLDAQQLRDRMIGLVPGATLAELDRAFAGARTTYLAGDYERSVQTLRTILEELAKLPDGDEVFEQWKRAMLRLAKAESDLGHADTSAGLVEQVVRADPRVQVDPSQFPPRFARQVDEARARLQALPAYSLTVKSPSRGALVFVNGRGVGSAPVAVKLARGRYRVTGSIGPSRTPAADADLMEGDAAVMLDFTVPDSLRPGLGPGLALLEADRSQQIVAAGAFLRLDAILVTDLVSEGGVSYLSGTLYDVRRGMLTREARVRLNNQSLPAGGGAALADFLVTGQATSSLVEVRGASGRPDLGTPGLTTSGPDLKLATADQGPPGTSVLGWAAFGAGIATVGLAGVSVWQFMEMSSNYDAANAMNGGRPPVDPVQYQQYQAYQAAGDSAKTTATITGVAAGACAVGTVVMSVIARELGPIRF